LCDLFDTSIRRLNRGGHKHTVDILSRWDGADGIDVGDLVDRERSTVIGPYTDYIEPIKK